MVARRKTPPMTLDAWMRVVEAGEGQLEPMARAAGTTIGDIRYHARREPWQSARFEWLKRVYGRLNPNRTKLPEYGDHIVAEHVRTSGIRGASIALQLDNSTVWMMACRKPDTYPLTAQAYAEWLDAKERARDPRADAVRAATARLQEALPLRPLLHELRAAADAVHRANRDAWPRVSISLRPRRSADIMAALWELMVVCPDVSAATTALGGPAEFIAMTQAKSLEFSDWVYAQRVRYKGEMHAERLRRVRARSWDMRYGAATRRYRRDVIAEVQRRYGTLARYGAETKGQSREWPTSERIRKWMQSDPDLLPQGFMATRYGATLAMQRAKTIAVTDDQLRQAAVIMRESATGDRWWQWDNVKAWVGPYDHSARLMLEQVVRGLPTMLARLEPMRGKQLWDRDGWVVDSRTARWDPASRRVEWLGY